MRSFTVTYWTGATLTVEADTITDAAALFGYTGSMAEENGIHIFHISDDVNVVTNSDGEEVATITADEPNFPEGMNRDDVLTVAGHFGITLTGQDFRGTYEYPIIDDMPANQWLTIMTMN